MPWHGPANIYNLEAGNSVKIGARDEMPLERTIYCGSYSEVVPLREEDEAYRDYMRVRGKELYKYQVHVYLHFSIITASLSLVASMVLQADITSQSFLHQVLKVSDCARGEDSIK